MSRNRQTRIEQLENAGRLITAQKQRIAELEAEAASKAHIKSYEHPLSAEDARGLLARIQSLEAELTKRELLFKDACRIITKMETRDPDKHIAELETALNELNAYDADAETVALRAKVAALTEVLKQAREALLKCANRADAIQLPPVTEYWSVGAAKEIHGFADHAVGEISKVLGE